MFEPMKHLSFIIAIVIIGVMALSACGSDDEDDNSDSEDSGASRDRVDVQLKWTHNPQFAGFYVAERQGFYEDEDIDVHFIQGGPGIDVVESVRSGEVEVGIAAGDRIIEEIVVNDAPFMIVGATYQTNPLAYVRVITEDNPRIESAEDWQGLRVGAFDDRIVLYGILDSFGLSTDDVEILRGQDFDTSLTAFLEGEVDVRSSFRTNEALTLQSQGYDLQFFYGEDYGVLMYQDVIYINTNAMNEDLTERFMRATLRGWQHAIENPDDVVAAVIQLVPSQNEEAIAEVWQASIPLIDDGQGILRLEPAVFDSMINIMVQQGIMESAPPANTVYTSQYLQ